MRHKTVLAPVCVLVALLVACGGGSQPKAPYINIFGAIAQQNVSVVKQHMDVGTNPNSFVLPEMDWSNASALHLAVLVGNQEIVQLLLDNGADIDINAEDQTGGTSLEWAILLGGKDMTEFMVDAGVDINAKDNRRLYFRESK